MDNWEPWGTKKVNYESSVAVISFAAGLSRNDPPLPKLHLTYENLREENSNIIISETMN